MKKIILLLFLPLLGSESIPKKNIPNKPSHQSVLSRCFSFLSCSPSTPNLVNHYPKKSSLAKHLGTVRYEVNANTGEEKFFVDGLLITVPETNTTLIEREVARRERTRRASSASE